MGERGQAAVLAALCMFTMVVFVALATNMGTLVSDRIRIQNVADAAAYAGSLEQARNMNIFARHNEGMYTAARYMRGFLTLDSNYLPFSPPIRAWPNPDCRKDKLPALERAIDGYEKLTTVHHAAMVARSRVAQKTAVSAANLTADINMKGMGLGRSFENFREWPKSPTFFMKPMLETNWDPEMIDDDTAAELVPVELEFNYAFIYRMSCCPGGLRGIACRIRCFPICLYTSPTRTVPTWWYKRDPSPTVYFPVRLIGTPLKKFMDIRNVRGYFGSGGRKNGSRTDRLVAYAVAKPYGGSIGAPDSVVDHGKETIKVFTKSAGVYTPEKIEGLDNYFRPTYRARIAGVQEELGSRGLYGAPPIATPGELFTSGPRKLKEEEFEKMLH